MVSPISCGLARPRSLVGEKPTQVTVSHGPGIQPCRCSGNRILDAEAGEEARCNGPGEGDRWLRSCGTAGKPGGNREDKHQPVPLGEPGLLTKSWPFRFSIAQRA